MKHLEVDLHFVRNQVRNGLIRVSHVHSADQLADPLTKPLSKPAFQRMLPNYFRLQFSIRWILAFSVNLFFVLKAVILWTYEPSERDARLANEALKSKKKTITQLQVIVEIACASSPDHLVAVRQAYCGLFNCSLEEDIAANVPMPVQKILIGLVRSYRYDKELVDPSLANAEAAILREAIRTKQLDSDNHLMILSTRNFHQLRATFECYKQNYGFSIDQDIKSCGKGLLESILKVVIWCIDSPEKHFAEVVRASIVGIGTDEESLTRAIVTRAEVDMMKVRGEYFIANKTSLDNAVIGDTSGDYMKFLMTLLGAKV
uniref:Annexin D3-like n=1 Tax=Nicotiana tabacum TaxID=4097 RepID=A0A1S4CX89_TOBAC|nr:PREDICTED: annexin D3-like [Nicotiana tabacum]